MSGSVNSTPHAETDKAPQPGDTTVRCAACGAVLPRLQGTDYPAYHLEPGTSLRKCPGSDKPGVVVNAQEAKRA